MARTGTGEGIDRMLRIVGRIAGLGLVSGWLTLVCITGCGTDVEDPVVISVAGRTTLLSNLASTYDRINGGPTQWDHAAYDKRKDFTQLVANKEVLVAHARAVYMDDLSGREKLIFDRWLEKKAMEEFWPKVRASIEVPAAHIASVAEEMRNERKLRQAVCRYEEDARAIFARVQGGEQLETVAQEFAERNSENTTWVDIGWVNGPNLAGPIAKALFELDPNGGVAPPFETERYGWHVIECNGEQRIGLADVQAAADDLGTRLYQRDVVAGIVDSLTTYYSFEILEDGLGPVLRCFSAMYDSMNGERRSGVNPDFQALPPPYHRFAPEDLTLPLVRWSQGIMTVGDFVETLWKVDLDYWPTTGSEEKIATQVKRRMTRWALMEEAQKAKIMEDPEFAEKIRVRRDELFLDKFYSENIKAYGMNVTEGNVRSFWDKHQNEFRSRDLVGYGFIRFPEDSRDLAWRSYEQLQAGQQWPMVASDARMTNGRVLFEPQLDPTDGAPYPDLTAVALKYEPRADGAPVYTEPQLIGDTYVILRIYVRMRPNTLDFESARQYVLRDLQRRALEDSLMSALDVIAEEHGLKVDWDAIR